MTGYVQIEWLCGDIEEARTVVSKLLNRKLIACANIITNVESHYVWQGTKEVGKEVKVLMKSHESCFDAIEQMIEEMCEYDVPPILSFPVVCGNLAYLQWLSESVTEV